MPRKGRIAHNVLQCCSVTVPKTIVGKSKVILIFIYIIIYINIKVIFGIGIPFPITVTP